jgi:hypothetical protein
MLGIAETLSPIGTRASLCPPTVQDNETTGTGPLAHLPFYSECSMSVLDRTEALFEPHSSH